jgi:hypothetical protein
MAKQRVLVCGMSRMQTGAVTRLGVVQFGAHMAQALRDAGHDVESRPAVVGEPLGGVFDVVLMGISPTGTVGAFTYGAWDVLARARAEGCALGLWIDDHKVHKIRESIKSDIGTPTKDPIIVEGKPTFETGARLVKDHFAGRRDRAWALDHLPELVGTGSALLSREWPTTIISAHRWGDHDLIVKAMGLQVPRRVFVDPSAYAPEHRDLGLTWDERKPVWVSAALPDKDSSAWPVRRQRLTWEVQELGAKKAGQAQVTEAEVYEEYQRGVGVVSMLRKRHDGSGWWRVRYTHAARTRSLVLASPADARAMGEPFDVPVETVEAMTSSQLRDLAHAQADAYFAAQWTKEQFSGYLDQILAFIVEHERGPVTG